MPRDDDESGSCRLPSITADDFQVVGDVRPVVSSVHRLLVSLAEQHKGKACGAVLQEAAHGFDDTLADVFDRFLARELQL